MRSDAANSVRRFVQAILCLGFVAILGLTTYKTWANVAEHADQSPTVRGESWRIALRDLRRFPEDFEPFFNKRVAWRDIHVRRFSRFRMDRLGVSPSPRVLFGADEWLFFNHAADPVYAQPGTPELDVRLRHWQAVLPEWRAWLEQRGIRLLVVIAPDKQSVYPECLPAFAAKSRPAVTPLDSLLANWRGVDPKLDVLDLREPLQAAKPNGALFYRTDTHWNPHGVRVGYQATARRMGWSAKDDADFYVTGGQIRDGDLGDRMLGYWTRGDEWFDDIQLKAPAAKSIEWHDTDDGSRLDYLQAEAWERPSGEGGRCLLFHDSFGHSLYARWLAEHCTRLVAVPSNHLDPAMIAKEKPDVVILEIVERLIQSVSPRRPGDPPKRLKGNEPRTK